MSRLAFRRLLFPLLCVCWVAPASLLAQVEEGDTRVLLQEYTGPFGVVGGRIVDEYKFKGYRIISYFYDPLDSIPQMYPNFTVPDSMVKPDEKFRIYTAYLGDNALYVFEVHDKKDELIRYYCLRGRPMDHRKVVLYRMESIRPGVKCVDPFQPKTYADSVLRSYNGVTISGYLPTNMKMFIPEKGGKEYVPGEKVFFLGKMTEPTPYEKYKEACNFYLQGEFRL